MSTDDHLAFCLGLRVIFISSRSTPRAPLMWQASRRTSACQAFGLGDLATHRWRDAPRGRYPCPSAPPTDASFLSSTATHKTPYRRRRVVAFPPCCLKVELENSAEPNPAEPIAPRCVGRHAPLANSNHHCSASIYFAQIGRDRRDCIEITDSPEEAKNSICTEPVG